jgi:hypothetical protein
MGNEGSTCEVVGCDGKGAVRDCCRIPLCAKHQPTMRPACAVEGCPSGGEEKCTICIEREGFWCGICETAFCGYHAGVAGKAGHDCASKQEGLRRGTWWGAPAR